MFKLESLGRAAVMVIAGLFSASLITSPARGSFIEIAAHVGLEVADKASVLALTYAAAHTSSGTAGGPGLHPGFGTGPQASLTGATSSSDSSDFFAHPVPPPKGNDVALAHADATSRLLGWDTIVNTNATTQKGDFAIAGALARAAGEIQTKGNVSFNLTLGLGRLTLTAALDPGLASYDLQVTNLGLTVVNQNITPPLLASGLPKVGFTTAVPETVYYSLHLDFNALTGKYNVINTSNFFVSGSLLTKNDFQVGLFPDVDNNGNTIMRPGIALNDSALGNFSLSIPSLTSGADSPIAIDSVQFEVAAIPEPSSIALLCVGATGVIGHTWARRGYRTGSGRGG